MSTIDVTNIVIGNSVTADNNYQFNAPDDGTLTLKTAGGTRTILTVDAAGNINPGIARSMVRLNTANGYGSSNTVYRRFTNVVTNVGSDITYADSATLGATFTINTSGVYSISYTDSFNPIAFFGIVHGLGNAATSGLTTVIQSLSPSNVIAASTNPFATYPCNCSATLYLEAGSCVRANGNGTAAGLALCYFIITRVG